MRVRDLVTGKFNPWTGLRSPNRKWSPELALSPRAQGLLAYFVKEWLAQSYDEIEA